MSEKKNSLFQTIVGISVIVTCLAAVLVVPEVRKAIELDLAAPFSPTLPNTQIISTQTNNMPATLTKPAEAFAQKVQWIPNIEGAGGGLCIDWSHTLNCPADKNFIPWDILKIELEQSVLPQVPDIPKGSSLTVQAGPDGKPNTVIQVIGPNGAEIAQVWIGENPENFWNYDGLICLGDPKTLKVWATFARYSDGTYVKK